jgi:hypothetical protein
LPGDDAAEFRRLRHGLFQTYQPRTTDEAQCVDAMAGLQWRMARCRRWQAVYDAKLDALLCGDPDATAGEHRGAAALQHCEADPHRWMHRSMDCVLQESRLERLMTRAREKLLTLQHQRRQNLIAGAVEAVVDYRDLEREADVRSGDGAGNTATPGRVEETTVACFPAPGAGGPRRAMGSSGNGKRKNGKRTAPARPSPQPREQQPPVGHG